MACNNGEGGFIGQSRGDMDNNGGGKRRDLVTFRRINQ